MILGESLNNLYEIDFMRATINYLNQKVADSPVWDLTSVPTHYYIKITAVNDQDLQFLDDLDKSDDIDAPVLPEYP